MTANEVDYKGHLILLLQDPDGWTASAWRKTTEADKISAGVRHGRTREKALEQAQLMIDLRLR